MSTKYTQPSGMNKFWLGFLLGLGFPVVFFLLYFMFRFHDLTFGNYWQRLISTGTIVHVMSLSVFPNLIPFMFFVRTNRFRSGRGTMAITIIFAIIIFALKFIL
jgi:hypothetical protein